MVGVREPGFGGGVAVGEVGLLLLEEEEEVGWTEDGTKEMERVPENRMTDTARATGRTAVRGFG